MNAVTWYLRLVGTVVLVLATASPVLAQKPGGILHVHHRDSPASMSIHEEATLSTVIPVMGVMNNLVMYDQDKAQNSLSAIVPDLAESWSWSRDHKSLTFKLRSGVRWHDGEPFTAADVKCTVDLLLGRGAAKLRVNPRGGWYRNIEDVTVTGDAEVTLRLKRPQPALLALLASGYSPIYPCHVTPAQMRRHPIGTGPFKFVEFKPNQSIKVTRNLDYWKKRRPYLDGVEYTIIPNRSTAVLGFVAGKFDMTFPTEISVPLIKDIASQAPRAQCELVPTNASTNLLINRDKPPFGNAEFRRAMVLALDRKAFIDTLSEGQADIGGAMLPAPAGIWGLPDGILRTLPGYATDVENSRTRARAIMRRLGYGPEKHLSIKVAARNIAPYRDPAVILIDQLKHIYIDGELDTVETANWFPKIARKDYQIGLNLTGSAVDDPDQQFYENYACGSPRNYSAYCNREIDRMVDLQSVDTDQERRKRLVWEIDRKLQEDVARPIITHDRSATCWQPHVKGVTLMVNSSYNGWRMEDWWLDK